MSNVTALRRRTIVIIAIAAVCVAICIGLSTWVLSGGTFAHALTDFVGTVGTAVLISLGVLWLIRSRLSQHEHRPSNDVMGFVYATIGVIYGVILGFIVITVWQEFQDATARTDQEALTVANLIRLSPGLPESSRAEAQQTLMDYLNIVVTNEWPQMEADKPLGDEGIQKINTLWDIYAQAQAEQTDSAYFSAGLDQLTKLGTLRRERALTANESLPAILWIVLVAGGALTVAFAGGFSVESWGLHAWMVAALAALIALLLLLVVEMNQPFRGDIRVDDNSFRFVMDQFADSQNSATSGYVVESK
jgi:zinc transporter ZupT